MFKLDVPFIANTSDNLHCFQAALSMVVKYFYPVNNYTFDELDRFTEKLEGKSTWPQAGLIWMNENGFEVKNIEVFDYEEFIKTGADYLYKLYGKEAGDYQTKTSDIPKEQKKSQEFIKEIKTEFRVPQANDLISLLKDGYLPICLVNAFGFTRDKKGYSGHMVVIIGYDEKGFYIHDPGLPPLKERYVTFDVFERAWADPDEKAQNVMAFRKR
jgi:hypothetical protein